MRVLLVDDDSSVLKQAEIFLERGDERLDIETAPSAEKGLELLEEEDFDAIVSDYQMPGMDGLDFLETVREERGSDIPFIIFTGKGREEVAIEALNLGADRYLRKGGSPKSQYGVLADAIIQEVRRREAEEELRKSEGKFRRAFETIPDPVVLFDEEGVVVDVSEASLRELGFEREEVIGSSLWDAPFFPEETVEKVTDRFERREEGEEVPPYTVELETKEGERILVEVNAVKFEGGGSSGEIVIARDITERKETEENLKRYKKAVQSSDDSIYMIDKDYRYVFANDEHISRLFDDGKIPSCNKDEVVGRKHAEIHSDEKTDALKDNVGGILEKGKPITEEYEFNTVDRWSSRTYSPVKGHESGEIEGIIIVSEDITERKKAEEREDFLHSLLRHDVSNKLQVIRGYLELVEDFDLSEEAEEYLSLSEKAVGEGGEIIEKVRTLRRAQEEKIREVEISSTIFDAVDEVEGFAEEMGVEIDVDCPAEGCEVLAGSLLDRVFSNILENAVQHSGGSKIRVRGIVSDDEVKCVVEDDGEGISDDKKDRIFNKGYTTDEDRGTGLGMFLVETLLETYDASVEVKDSEMGGARFDIYLKKA